MSERMIELQRARLLAANGGGAASAGKSVTNGAVAAAQPKQTPTEAAMARISAIDRRTRCFLDRIRTERDDSQSSAAGSNGPTVPTALSRRMLHRRGVGYRDSAVAALTSATADRFLATVLTQAVTCRDQRRTRKSVHHRQQHKRHYQQDADDRIRRHDALQTKHDEYHVSCMDASALVHQKIAAKKIAGAKKKKKSDSVLNGVKRHAKPPPLDSLESAAAYDSLDETEVYYQNQYPDDESDSDESDDDDSRMMILEDIKRPLLAYNFHLEGKLGLDRSDENDNDQVHHHTTMNGAAAATTDDTGDT